MAGPGQRCHFCGCAIYGRSDKRYCTATCRRDASRVRKRVIRMGEYEFFGTERTPWYSIETYLIPRLEREYGANHRIVQVARRRAQELQDAKYEELGRIIRDMSWLD